MKTRDYFHLRILLIIVLCLLSLTTCEEVFDSTTDNKIFGRKDDSQPSVKDSRGLFSPRMDYEQWKPLGRGDPLKNDPTYDYVPPVLDRVHYWIDPASRKPDPPSSTEMKKTEILVLGVSSKKPSNNGFQSQNAENRKDMFESFLKFVEGPNFNYQRRPQYSAGQNYFGNGFYKGKSEQKEPYTMLVPPPMPSHQEPNNYQQLQMSSTSTTTPVPFTLSSLTPSSISIEEANLIYHSSSLSPSVNWKGSNTYATIAESSSQVTRKIPPPVVEGFDFTQQQLPLVRAPESFKETSFSIIPSMNVVIKPLGKLQSNKNLDSDSADVVMHKGQVTDDILDISNTYVNIGKPDAQMQTSTGMGIDLQPTIPKHPVKQQLINSPLISSVLNPMISENPNQQYRKQPPVKKLEMMPITLQTMQTMQTMLPPKKQPLLHSLLKKEVTIPLPTTTTPPPTTTSVPSLTTDPLFKHYKQPIEPLRGPLYLIIQGHSKVKTYGPSKQINGISVQETNEIPRSDDRQTEYSVKHLHDLKKENKEPWDREKRDNRQGRLQTLNHVVVTGYGAIDFADDTRNPNRRHDDNIKETEFVVKYDVSSGEDVTSEVYHKGIVESEIPPNRKGLVKPIAVKKDK